MALDRCKLAEATGGQLRHTDNGTTTPELPSSWLLACPKRADPDRLLVAVVRLPPIPNHAHPGGSGVLERAGVFLLALQTGFTTFLVAFSAFSLSARA